MARRVAKKELSTSTYLAGQPPTLYKDVLPIRTIPCLAWWITWGETEDYFAPSNGFFTTAVDVAPEAVVEMVSRIFPDRPFAIQNMTVGQCSMCSLIDDDRLYFNDARGINEKGEVVL
jgi:hypothetical protein